MAKLRNRYKPKATPRERQIEDALRKRERQVKRYLAAQERQGAPDGRGAELTSADIAKRLLGGQNIGLSFNEASEAMQNLTDAVRNGSLTLGDPKVWIDGKSYEFELLDFKTTPGGYRNQRDQLAAYQYAMSMVGKSGRRTAHAVSQLTGLTG